jgi:hypothetical protein
MRLTPEDRSILDPPEETWQRTAQEAAVIDLALRTEIRDTNVDEVKARLPAYVAIDLNEQQTQLVSQVAQNFIIANRLRNDEATAATRQAERDKVPPHHASLKPGQTIVRQGEIERSADRVAGAFGLAAAPGRAGNHPVTRWAALLAAPLIGLYVWRFEPQLWRARAHCSAGCR